ncbi:MAG: AAA family ATPase [Clostridiales bacterium]|nr:AAA family ATPase [Clostridiales bacterium]
MREMKDELLDIYRDFYGSGSDDKGSGGGSGFDDRIPDDKVGTADKGNNAGPQEIETEVVTQSEFTVETSKAQEKQEAPSEPEKSGMEELNELIGLTTIKHDVEELVGLAKVRKMREEKGMKAVPVSLHLVFSGNPGTGKTTVARILAKLYKEIGILSTGQLVETDRSGLVAGYVGQTAIKTRKKIEEAMGGVLFIDEAYTLNQEGENYGQESIDTILKAMEDHRDKFVVIVAGYTELMKAFVESNPGLKSRFNKFFEFPDYTVDELQAIFKMQCSKYQYKLTDEAEKAVKEEIIRREAEKGENFANAREVRNLFETIITNQAARVANIENVDEETLSTITMEDLEDLDGDGAKDLIMTPETPDLGDDKGEWSAEVDAADTESHGDEADPDESSEDTEKDIPAEEDGSADAGEETNSNDN